MKWLESFTFFYTFNWLPSLFAKPFWQIVAVVVVDKKWCWEHRTTEATREMPMVEKIAIVAILVEKRKSQKNVCMLFSFFCSSLRIEEWQLRFRIILPQWDDEQSSQFIIQHQHIEAQQWDQLGVWSISVPQYRKKCPSIHISEINWRYIWPFLIK